jgi:xylulose-5-phosphate/fructose-6-phosphate phosphoketolase
MSAATTKKRARVTAPFDMTVMNELDRFHLAMDTIDLLPKNGGRSA